MAIYHLNANVISRARGQSIVAAVAYRFGTKLRDERYGVLHNYVGKRVVAHSEIMAPDGMPAWVHDREVLWNRVEAAERRKDSQLARVIEIGLPVELMQDECVALLRDYVATQFVAKGMVADFGIRRENPANPHAHILLTLRVLSPAGFGPKERRWNGKSNLLEWRSAWAERANEHLARAGHAVRIDHRTLEAQHIDLTPARRMGTGRNRERSTSLPDHLSDRIAEQRQIARENGEAILENPALALRALTRQSPSFTRRDLDRFLRSRTDGDAQFEAVRQSVKASSELVALPPVDGHDPRFTSGDMLEAARSLKNRTISMANRRGRVVTAASPDNRLRVAFEYLIGPGDAKAIALEQDAAKEALLDAVSAAWSADGLQVLRVTHITLTFDEEAWLRACVLTRTSVLIIDGAEMLGLKQLERVLAAVDRARAKAALIGDSGRLAAMGDTLFHNVLHDIGLETSP